MPTSIKVALRRIGFLLLLYSLVRFCFIINNWGRLQGEGISSIFFAALHGVRFDLSIVLTINLIFIIFWILPLRWHEEPWFNKALHYAFVFVNGIFLVMNMADIELVNFNARRMTWAFFTLKKDMSDQIPQLITYYWYWSIVTGFLLLLLAMMTPRRDEAAEEFQPRTMGERAKTTAEYLAFVFLIVLGVRGGLQNKPVREAHAFQSSAMLGHLTLNTPFTVIHSRKKSAETELHYFSDADAKEILDAGIGEVEPISLPQRRVKNVVLIILESFSREYMGEINGRTGYTPFLDELANRSLFFTNHFANARRSIDAIPALVAGLPALLREPFLLSSYQGAQVRGLADVLSAHGYKTGFYHGAENGSMFFDSFASRAGYDKYVGMSEYPESKRDWDGFWGILDGPFLNFFEKELNQTATPFFTTVFTLSSHQPYPVPAELKDKFPEGTLEIHRSIGYTDYALNEFFKAAEKEPWFAETLFVITADHTQKSDDPNYADTLGAYRVPLLFFQKDAEWAGQKVDRVTQHVDISASVLDYLGYKNEKMIPLGRSVFGSRAGTFIARDSDFFIFHSGDCTAKMSPEGQWQPEGESSSCSEQHERYFKAYVQYFINGVIKNNLF